MVRKTGTLLLVMILLASISGCAMCEKTPARTPSPAPGTQQPTASPEATPTPEPTPTPETSPTPLPPPDVPTIVSQYMDGVPDLILDADTLSGTVAVDEEFAVVLEENTSTGNLWQYDGMGGAAVVCTLTTHWQPESDMVGVPGLRVLAFRINEAGQYTLTILLTKPDGGAADVKMFDVTVQ